MKQIYILLLAIFAYSCSNGDTTDNAKTLCKLNMQNRVEQSTNLSEVLGNPVIIPLNITENGMVGEVNKVIQKDDYLYILSNFKKINKFDKNGNCLFEIFKIGKGKGEYSSIYDFDVDGDKLYAVTRTEKIVVYDAGNGMFEDEIMLTFPCSAVKACDEKLVCESISEGSSLMLTDLKGNILNKFGNNKDNPPVMSAVPFVDIDEQNIAYTIFNHDDILVVDTKNNTSSDWSITGMDNVMTSNLYKSLVEQYGKVNQFGLMDVGDKMDDYYCVSAFRKAEDNVLVTFYKGSENFLGMSNVKTGKNSVYDVSKIKDDIFGADANLLIDNIYSCEGDAYIVTHIQASDIVNDQMKLKYSANIENGNPIIALFQLD